MASDLACPEGQVLCDFLLGRLPAEEAERLAPHVESCPDCLAVLHAMRADDLLLNTLRDPEVARAETPSAFVEALMRELTRWEAFPPSADTAVSGDGLAPADTDGEPTQEVYDFLAPPQQADELGRLGPYRVLQVLGVGGMGVVFEAEDVQLRRRVALKTLKPVLAASPSARRRFLREARATAGIAHTHIVTILHVGEDRGVPYLAMPLLEGETLEARLRRDGTLPVPEVLRVGREIAEGLDAAHRRGVIHRDIKPSNVFLAEAGAVKILDFGLARAVSDAAHLTQSGVIVGTPAYMAPEQAHGAAQDARCDLFGLGAVLYHLCTGAAPFRGANTMGILRALEMDRPRPPHQLNPAVPRALSGLILRLLAKRPEDRPPSARAVAEALDASATAAPPCPRWRRPAVAAVAFTLLLAGLFALFPRGDDGPGSGAPPAITDAAIFAPAATYPCGLYPRWAAVADFNGDGKLDVVVTNLHDHRVSVLLGNGDGTFRPATAYDAGQWFATSVTVADLDGDGNMDLVVANSGHHKVSVLRGNGDGTFRPPVQYPAGVVNPQQVVVADFDGDGKSDLAVACLEGVAWLRGKGDGTFHDPVRVAAISSCWCLAAGDFDGDGKPDLVVVDAGSHQVRVLSGNGDGTFRPAAASYEAGLVYAVAVGDLDGDGKLDVAVGDPSGDGVRLLLGNGDGTFRPTARFPAGSNPYALVAADFNRDGRLDLAVTLPETNEVVVLPGNGDGTFAAPLRFPVGRSPNVPAVGDFNGDGAPDLAVPNFDTNTLSVLLNRPAPRRWTFAPDSFGVGKDPRAVAVGDFDGDGRLDLAVANQGDGSVSLLLGRGDGAFDEAARPKVGKEPCAVAVGDFNRDGRLDLAVADSAGDAVWVLLGTGGGRLREAVPYRVGKKPLAVAVADLNRDGKPDLVVTAYDGGGVSVLLGCGDGTFRDAVHVPVGPRAVALAVADFNRDGKPDLAVTHEGPSDSAVRVLLGNGDGTFRPPVAYPAGAYPKAVVTGDFNGDGVPDLATANWGSMDVTVLLGKGDGTFRPPVQFPIGAFSFGLTAADFDGDGRLDLAVSGANMNQVMVLRGDGRGGFARAVPFNVGAQPMGVAAADLDRDGKSDLVVVNAHSGDVSVLRNQAAAARPRPFLTIWNQNHPDRAGKPVTIGVRAFDARGQPDPAFVGTILFRSSDPGARLPEPYHIGAADKGSKGFQATFSTRGGHRLTVEDIAGRLDPATITVRVLGPEDVHLVVTAPAEVTAGTPFTVTVRAVDRYDRPPASNDGTLRFTCTDRAATLPGDFTLPADGLGQRTLTNGVTLRTPGNWTITATDTSGQTQPGSATITVGPAISPGGR